MKSVFAATVGLLVLVVGRAMASTFMADLNYITNNGEYLDVAVAGTVSEVVLFGDNAFPLLLWQDGTSYGGCSTWGAAPARACGFGHTGYQNPYTDPYSGKDLFANVLRWLGRKDTSPATTAAAPTVFRHGSSSVLSSQEISYAGLVDNTNPQYNFFLLDAAQMSNVSVLAIYANDASLAGNSTELAIITEYLNNGGSLYVCGELWVWTAYDGGTKDTYPPNRLLSNAGIVFTSATVSSATQPFVAPTTLAQVQTANPIIAWEQLEAAYATIPVGDPAMPVATELSLLQAGVTSFSSAIANVPSDLVGNLTVIEDFVIPLLRNACIANTNTSNIRTANPVTPALLSTSASQYATIPQAPQLRFGIAQSFTIEFDIYAQPQPNYVPIITNKQGGWGGYVGWGVWLNGDGTVELQMGDWAYPTAHQGWVQGSEPVTNGAWHHIAMVVDRHSELLLLYQDGAFVSNQSIAGMQSTVSQYPNIYIAQDATTTYSPGSVYMLIDDLRIWNASIPAVDLMGFSCAGANLASHPFAAQLLAHYTFSEGSGVAFADSSTYANTGSVVTMMWVTTPSPPRQCVVAFVNNVYAGQSYVPVNFVVTSNNPTLSTMLRDRACIQFVQSIRQFLPPTLIPAHNVGAGDFFPGTIDASATAVDTYVFIDSVRTGWFSTGRYAFPGQPVTVIFPSAWASMGVAMTIGCHTDQLYNDATWNRWPQISTSSNTVVASTVFGKRRSGSSSGNSSITLTNYFGGIVYLDISTTMMQNNVSGYVLFTGTTWYPHYVDGVTDPAAFVASVATAVAPFAELEFHDFVLSLPVQSQINTVSASILPQLASFWNRTVAFEWDLAQAGRKTYKERLASDMQISIGWMHSGYPVMTFLGGSNDTLHPWPWVSHWGYFHELGHNQQRGWWCCGTDGSTTEVTVNIFTLYLEDRMNMVHRDLSSSRAETYTLRESSPSTAFATADLFGRLIFYLELRQAFCWQGYKNTFASYLAANPTNIATTAELRDEWVWRFSVAVGKDISNYAGPNGFGFATLNTVTYNASALVGLPAWTGPSYLSDTFSGSNPNGTAALFPLASPATETFSITVPAAQPRTNNGTVITMTVGIAFLNFTGLASHTTLTLTSPQQCCYSIVLASPSSFPAGVKTLRNIVFADAATTPLSSASVSAGGVLSGVTVRPQQPLSTFIGNVMEGPWQLVMQVGSGAAGDASSEFTSWTIAFTNHTVDLCLDPASDEVGPGVYISPAGTPTPNPHNPPPPKKTTNATGTVVAGTVIGVILAAALLFALFLIYRKRKASGKFGTEMEKI